MLTKKQVEGLPKGFHSNTDLMKRFPGTKHFSKGYSKLFRKTFNKNQ